MASSVSATAKTLMGPILSYTSGEWHTFISGVKYGDFDGFAEPT